VDSIRAQSSRLPLPQKSLPRSPSNTPPASSPSNPSSYSGHHVAAGTGGSRSMRPGSARQLRRNRGRMRQRRCGRSMEVLGHRSRAVRDGLRVCRSRGVRDLARLLHQGPSPTAIASSTAAPAASSAAADKAPSVNHGILNLQILQLGETMQHLLEASQILSSLTCLRVSTF